MFSLLHSVFRYTEIIVITLEDHDKVVNLEKLVTQN